MGLPRLLLLLQRRSPAASRTMDPSTRPRQAARCGMLLHAADTHAKCSTKRRPVAVPITHHVFGGPASLPVLFCCASTVGWPLGSEHLNALGPINFVLSDMTVSFWLACRASCPPLCQHSVRAVGISPSSSKLHTAASSPWRCQINLIDCLSSGQQHPFLEDILHSIRGAG
ncbi:hypothetical protein PAHAL_7G343300 [Panicum hallii]|uniref:Uncharacterized protein n=1 Tax=Panicum hallii TaxID=206008 RepID=A0A2T8IEE6_9POAL|nr:hypothetical protein PAHAL_7G343300 [Panicum hallii]